MRNIKLLDCTLRDGGYINDWEFGHNNLISVFERLADAGVDIVEIGFIDDRRPFDINRSIMPDTASVARIYGDAKKRAPMVVGMIDYGTCTIENIQPCAESYIDGIRVIFKEHFMHEAMEYCAKLKALGYKVFSQLVSVTTYTDESMLKLIDLVNEVEPYAVSMVDTYGLLHPDDMLHYYEILDAHVKPSVQIGFHAHNNLQLAYANALTFISRETDRDIVVDGTLFGMGKSAGNAPLELLAMRLNEKFGKDYKINPMLESIDETVMDFYKKAPWGFQRPYFLSSLNRVHPNYVSDFSKKQNLSASKLNDLLSTIEPESKKLLYDKDVSAQIYDDYIENAGSDTEARKALSEKLADKEILLVGPGRNISLQQALVQTYIHEHQPTIIAVNYIPDGIKADFVFTTNTKRYHDMQLTDESVIATSNVECRCGSFDYTVNRAFLLEKDAPITDNSFLMLLKLLSEIGAKDVVCVGFDGYSEHDDNYYKPTMEYDFVKKEAGWLNSHVRSAIAEFRNTMNITFLTYSAYDAEEDIHGAAF